MSRRFRKGKTLVGKTAPDAPEVEAWFAELQKHIDEELLPKMRGSRFVVGLLDDHIDIKLVMELGMALLLDKPLIIVADKNVLIPPQVFRIAEAIVRTNGSITEDREAQEQLNAVIRRMVELTETRKQ